MFNNFNGVLNMLLTIILCMVLVGFILQFFPELGLPGDILIQTESFSLYCPITTMVVAGIVVAVILKFLRRQ